MAAHGEGAEALQQAGLVVRGPEAAELRKRAMRVHVVLDAAKRQPVR
jgi:hypothetical protein